MPPSAVLPIIIIKSIILAIAAGLLAKHFRQVSLLGIFLAILSYQIVGIGIEWIMNGNLSLALQDIRIGFPGLLIQLFGGYLLLKSMQKI